MEKETAMDCASGLLVRFWSAVCPVQQPRIPGSIYIGEWNEGKRTGIGSLYWKDSGFYIGGWVLQPAFSPIIYLTLTA